MEKVEHYRQIVQEVLQEYIANIPSDEQVSVELSVDPIHDHYQIITVGWRGERRVYGCTVHFNIRQGKIWVQHDGTEVGLTNYLLERGVPKSDIVLGFHAPVKRPYTDFAIG